MTNLLTATETLKSARAKTRAACPVTKSDCATKLLARTKGATVADLTDATGWQPHSVRALLSGFRKKGIVLVREARKSGESCYHILVAQPGDGAVRKQVSAVHTHDPLTTSAVASVEAVKVA